MRILFANDGVSDVGGVHSYLCAVTGELAERGHTIGVAYRSDSGTPEVGARLRRFDCFRLQPGAAAIPHVRGWQPDICFSHNMSDLEVDSALADAAPLVKFMHGYFGTCVGGMKMHAFPRRVACHRPYGPACLALYLPRRCGQLAPRVMVRHWRWAERQRDLFSAYTTVVVASRHMRDEYVRSGLDPARIRVNPLFPPSGLPASPAEEPEAHHVVFLGRMTTVKGGELLLRAVAHATARLARPIRVTMIGDGPQARDWQDLAGRLRVPAAFPGWLTGQPKRQLLRTASVVALPGVWPEPFGLVGLEAGAEGVPALAVSAGGITEWLRDGTNGVAVPPPASARSLGDALAALLSDPARLRMLRQGARQVAEEMSLAVHVDRLEEIFAGARRAQAAAVNT